VNTEYTVTADGRRAYPGDAIWIRSSGGLYQMTVGECFEHEVKFTCVSLKGDVGAEATCVYRNKPEQA